MARWGKSNFEWLKEHISHTGEECVMWPFSLDTKGYPQVFTNAIRKANRVMCELAHGAPPTPKHQAAHSCGNRACVNPRHLSWKTQSENEADKRLHGTITRNTWGAKGKLNQNQIKQIKTSRLSNVELASRFGVNRGAIEYWRKKFAEA